MSNLVKSLGIAVLAYGCVFSVLGQDKGANLLAKWNIMGSTTIQDDGVIAAECKGEKDTSGVVQSVELNQTEAKTIEFSAESKAENASGDFSPYNYSIYIDIVNQDGTSTPCITAGFNTGTHDWEKASLTYTPTKPIKSLSYYLMFRNKTGKVWFKNAVLIQK